MVEQTSVADQFLQFLRTLELPPGLISSDALCDMNVPQWRFQLRGGEALAAWAKEEGMAGARVTPGRVTSAGPTTVLETVIETGGGDRREYSRNLWLLRTGHDGLVDEVVFYCTGPWDAQTRARQAREAPMFAP